MIETIAAVVAAVGVVFAGVAVHGVQRRRARQFEGLYVQRYWDLMDRLSLRALRACPYDSACDEDKRTVEQYLRLCEDQLEMRALGAITVDTHSVWVDGIVTSLAREPFRGAWSDVRKRRAGEFEYLRAMGENRDYDPLTCGWIRRWAAGVG